MRSATKSGKAWATVFGASALLAVGCSSSTSIEETVESLEVVETRAVFHERLSEASFDSLPDSLAGFITPTSRIVVGQVVDIRGNRAYVDIDEETLSEHQAGESTVFDELPEEQVAELIALVESGESPPPLEFDFDSPVGSWRTVELVVEAESQITTAGKQNLYKTVLVGVSLPTGVGIGALDGYKKIGRSAFFLDSSPVFGGGEAIQLDGALVGMLSETDEILALPYIQGEFAAVWLVNEPSIESLAEASATG